MNRFLYLCLVILGALLLASIAPTRVWADCPGCDVFDGFDSSPDWCIATCPVPDPFGGYCLYGAIAYTPRWVWDPDKEPIGPPEPTLYVQLECLSPPFYDGCTFFPCPEEPRNKQMLGFFLKPNCQPC